MVDVRILNTREAKIGVVSQTEGKRFVIDIGYGRLDMQTLRGEAVGHLDFEIGRPEVDHFGHVLGEDAFPGDEGAVPVAVPIRNTPAMPRGKTMNGMMPCGVVERELVFHGLEVESPLPQTPREGEKHGMAIACRNRFIIPVGRDIEDVCPMTVGAADLPPETIQAPMRPDFGSDLTLRVDQLIHIPDPVPRPLLGEMHFEAHNQLLRAVHFISTLYSANKSCRREHSMVILSSEALLELCRTLFAAAGVPADEAEIVARSLVQANLCGHDSHGVLRVPQYITHLRQGVYRVGVPLEILHETPATFAADGNWGLGQVQAYRLLQRLADKVASLGVAAGTLRHCGHIGRLGEYAEWAAERHWALIAAVNSHGAGRRVAPPGGTEGRISTNPICIGVPTSTHPVILDFSTSAAAEGKVRACFQKQQPCPEGWLIDHRGQPTTDPAVLYTEPRGSLLPFGGSQAYKGFGLGLLIDLLCGGLSGGQCSSPEFPINGAGNTALFILLNPQSFAGIDHFLQQGDALTAYVRSCPTTPGVTAITLPGDPERQMRQQRQREGIPIPDGTWELISQTAQQLGLPWPLTPAGTTTL